MDYLCFLSAYRVNEFISKAIAETESKIRYYQIAIKENMAGQGEYWAKLLNEEMQARDNMRKLSRDIAQQQYKADL